MTENEKISDNVSEVLKELFEKLSDRNSCLTQLAKARLQIIISIDKMSFNNGNDENANWAKWKELKEQAQKIDDLINTLLKH